MPSETTNTFAWNLRFVLLFADGSRVNQKRFVVAASATNAIQAVMRKYVGKESCVGVNFTSVVCTCPIDEIDG